MPDHFYKTEQFLPVTIEKAWDFFSSAKNLSLITPPAMDFKIVSELTNAPVYEGMLIDYTVKPLFGIKVQWQTEICKVEQPLFFTDRQVKGPYKLWEHTHTFIKKSNGVLMKDEVRYRLPLGILGRLMNGILVRKKLKEIFSYRENTLLKLFKVDGNND